MIDLEAEEPHLSLRLTFHSLLQAPEVFRIQPNAVTLSATAAHAAASRNPRPPTTPDARESTYCAKADCWSAAIFIYEVLCGSSPFGHIQDRKALEHAVLFEPIRAPSKVSAAAANFLCIALDRVPQTRMCIAEMISHPWLASAAEAAAVEQRDTPLLACTQPLVLPAVPTSTSAPRKNASRYNPCVSGRNNSPHTVIGFAAPGYDASMESPAINGHATPSFMTKATTMPQVHPQEGSQSSDFSESSDSIDAEFIPAQGPPFACAVKKLYATFHMPTSPSPARTSDGLRKCASASNCMMKHDHTVACSTYRSRQYTSTSAISTSVMPTSSLTQALLAQNIAPMHCSSSPSHSDYAHSPTYSVPSRTASMNLMLPEGSHDGSRSLGKSSSSGSAPVAVVTIVYAAAEQGRPCSPAVTVGTLPCITEAAIEREAVEPGRAINNTAMCTDAVCLNPVTCVPAGRCSGDGGRPSRPWDGDDDTDNVTTALKEAADTQQAASEPVFTSSGEAVKAIDRVCNNLVSAALKPVATAVPICAHRSTEELEGEVEDIVGGSSLDDDRSFDVRGSWGGSIDSTAGAAVVRMMDHFRDSGIAHTSVNPGRCGSVPSSNTASCEFAEGTVLNSCLCHSSCAECSDLNGTTEEEETVDGFSRSCSEKDKTSCFAACAELGPCVHVKGGDRKASAGSSPGSVGCGVHTAGAISIQPQHLVVQERGTGSGIYGSSTPASSSIAAVSNVRGDKPACLQHHRSDEISRAHRCGLPCAAAVEGTAQMTSGPVACTFYEVPGGALEHSLGDKQGCEVAESANAWRGADSTESLHVLAKNTPSQEQLSVLQTSPVYTGDVHAT